MKLSKRIITMAGAPVVLAGIMLVGSAAASPAVKPAATPTIPYTVTFTADVTTGNSSFAIDSTSCTLTGNNGKTQPCFLGGAGTLGPPESGSLSITDTKGDAFGPISLNLTQETATCADGTAVVITKNGPVTEPAKVELHNTVIQTASNMFIVKGTIKIGPNVNSCP
jgi:hypothetical protein